MDAITSLILFLMIMSAGGLFLGLMELVYKIIERKFPKADRFMMDLFNRIFDIEEEN